MLQDFVEKNKLGEVYYAPLDVHLGEDVVQPDILFVSKKRFSIITDEEIRGGPDLVIEILSPATAERDRTYKKTLYARHRVREYWIVDPESKTIEVMTLGKAGLESSGTYRERKMLKSPIFPYLTISLSEIF